MANPPHVKKRVKGAQLVYESVQAWVSSGAFQSGQFLPAERDLSEKIGVSRTTVQSGIQLLVRDGILIREPNCRPVIAELPKEPVPTRNEIAVWIQPDLQHLGAASILQGIRSAIEDRFVLSIGFPPVNLDGSVPEFEFLRKLARAKRAAGAIVWEAQGGGIASVYRELQEANIPVVFIDREPSEISEVDVVSTNNRRGAKKLVNHLIQNGHRSIAMVLNDEDASSVRDRLAGYRNALEDAGIPFRPELVFSVNVDEWRTQPGGPDGFLRRILSSSPEPTAIFSVNDGIALRLLETARSMGIRVPDQLSLAGFDWLSRNLPSGGELTTVAQPFEAVGRVAAQRLIEKIKQSSPSVPRHILLESCLVVRSTTASAPLSNLEPLSIPLSHPSNLIPAIR